MGRREKSVAYIDTHVAIWLYDALLGKFSVGARDAINRHDLMISPICKLEIQYLHEIGRFRFDAGEVCSELAESIGLMVSDNGLADVVEMASAIVWTRDPFDRLIVAEASIYDTPLITADRLIRNNYPHAVW